MSDPDDDEEALTWAGTRDPSSYEAPAAKPAKPQRAVKTPVAAEPGDDDAEENEDDRPSMSAPMLVALGVLGGIYALYTVGWFVSWQRFVYFDPDALESIAFRVQQVAAIVGPPLWFVAAMLFTRGRRDLVRLAWLVIGALVLIPWSFVLGR